MVSAAACRQTGCSSLPPYREQHIANRELGIIEKIDATGNLQLHLDSGRAAAFTAKENPNVDYGTER